MALIQGTYNFIPEILRGTDLVDTFVLGSGNEYVFGGAGEDVALFPLFLIEIPLRVHHIILTSA